MGMRRWILLLGAVLAIACAFGCSKKVTGLKANQPPVTRLFLAGPIDTISYRVRLHWSGDDPDGDVAGFEIQFQPGDGAFVDSAWKRTTAVDSIFALPIPNGAATFTFWVRAIDNQELRDPRPQHLLLNLRNRPPHVEFINIPRRPQGGIYRFLPVLSLQWSGTDPEGANTIRSYHLWLDGGTFDTLLTQSDTVLTLRMEHFGDVSVERSRTVYLSVTDEDGAVGDTTSFTWTVKPYTVGSPRVLLVDDYFEGTDNKLTEQDNMYRSVVGALTGNRYTIYDVQDFNRFRFSRDAAELLRHFDVIVWYNEGGALPLNLVAAVDPITAFLDAGHSMYLSALSVVGQDQILDGNFHRHYLGVDSTFCADVRNPQVPDCNFTLTARITVRSGNPAAPNDSLAVKGLGNNVDFYTTTDSTVKELYVPYDQAGDDTTLNGYVRADHVCAVTRTLPSGGRVTFASLPLYKMIRFGNRDAVVTRLVGSIVQNARTRPLRTHNSR